MKTPTIYFDTPETPVVYFDSRTNNVQRFVDKVKEQRDDWFFVNIKEQNANTDHLGHLVTYTDAQGQCPKSSLLFAENNPELILSVSSSGNRNFGQNFAKSADILSEKLNVPVFLKFELSGLELEVQNFINEVENYHLSRGR